MEYVIRIKNVGKIGKRKIECMINAYLIDSGMFTDTSIGAATTISADYKQGYIEKIFKANN